METIKLKNTELISLEAEIGHLLSFELSVYTKYLLTILYQNANAKLKPFVDLQQELIKKYGKEDEKGQISIQRFVLDDAGKATDKEAEPFTSFVSEIDAVAEHEVEIEYTPIDASILKDIKSDKNYPFLYKFIK